MSNGVESANGVESPSGGRPIDHTDRRTRRSVCVFCGSASGLPEVHLQAARELGREIARRGHRLVFGGSDVGLMRELSRSVHRHGGRVFGAIPRALVERGLAYGTTDELVVTENLRDHNDTFSVKTSAQAPQAVGPRSSAVCPSRS